jgi:hypothetical protein
MTGDQRLPAAAALMVFASGSAYGHRDWAPMRPGTVGASWVMTVIRIVMWNRDDAWNIGMKGHANARRRPL